MSNHGSRRFVVCIANIDQRLEEVICLGCFKFEVEDTSAKQMEEGTFEVIEGQSPYRLFPTVKEGATCTAWREDVYSLLLWRECGAA